jgi:hypothetical protein
MRFQTFGASQRKMSDESSIVNERSIPAERSRRRIPVIRGRYSPFIVTSGSRYGV